uniref:HSF-type DNA-binding domain-containing protein n=1 Tax=Ditylum brightwellii TaxID=49249 RepID=A0A7S2A744_9STRA
MSHFFEPSLTLSKKMHSTSQQSTQQEGALIHLVEAATALTQLVDGPGIHAKRTDVPSQSPNTSSNQSSAADVTDDEDFPSQPKNTSAQSQAIDPNALHSPSSFSHTVIPDLSPREIFPERLMSVLSNRSVSDVISWLPHGRSFVILRPDVFASRIMPVYFGPETGKPAPPSSTFKYPSFTRKLNRWGFRQISRGPDAGAFHHDLFRREQPELCRKMVCQKSRRPKSSKCTKPLPPKATSLCTSTDSTLPQKKRKQSAVPSRNEILPLSPAPAVVIPCTVSASSCSPTDVTRVSSCSNTANETVVVPVSPLNVSPPFDHHLKPTNPSIFPAAGFPLYQTSQQTQATTHTTSRTQHSLIAPRPPQRSSMTQRIPYTECTHFEALPNRCDIQIKQAQNVDMAKSMLYKAYLQALEAQKSQVPS